MHTRLKEAEIERRAYSTEHLKERAPVQGLRGGIPWAMHLEAYAAYCEKYGGQLALIDLPGRGCRGGFSTGELDIFIPGWRDRLEKAEGVRAQVAALTRERDEARAALMTSGALAIELTELADELRKHYGGAECEPERTWVTTIEAGARALRTPG